MIRFVVVLAVFVFGLYVLTRPAWHRKRPSSGVTWLLFAVFLVAAVAVAAWYWQ